MGGLIGISLWVALATVVPGLVTIASIYGAVIAVDPHILQLNGTNGIHIIGADSEWVWSAIAVTIMVLTQAMGILLEEYFIRFKLLGRETILVDTVSGITSNNSQDSKIETYKEYSGLYMLLAQLSDTEDTQGHLKRALAQFFLTNNTLVSFSTGIIVTVFLMVLKNSCNGMAIPYFILLLFFLVISYFVAKIRFRVMVKSLYATRIARVSAENSSEQKQ